MVVGNLYYLSYSINVNNNSCLRLCSWNLQIGTEMYQFESDYVKYPKPPKKN